MQLDIKLKAELVHEQALAAYAKSLNQEYANAMQGRGSGHTQPIRDMALALLGSPYHRIKHIRWPEGVQAWLLSLDPPGGGILTLSEVNTFVKSRLAAFRSHYERNMAGYRMSPGDMVYAILDELLTDGFRITDPGSKVFVLGPLVAPHYLEDDNALGR